MLRYENIAVSVMQLAKPLPPQFACLREPMIQSFLLHFGHHMSVLDDYHVYEGEFDELYLFDFETHYLPSKVQQDLRELWRSFLGTDKCSDDSSTDLLKPSDADVSEREGCLPRAKALD